MTAMASSMVRILGSSRIGADLRHFSNPCATSPAVSPAPPMILPELKLASLSAQAKLAAAQEPVRHTNLRRERGLFVKGMLAFNVVGWVGYAGTAFARRGPVERDTRGMAGSLRWKEPWVGVLILIPAVLDGVRFAHPDQKWAMWGSRAAKIGGVVLIAR